MESFENNYDDLTFDGQMIEGFHQLAGLQGAKPRASCEMQGRPSSSSSSSPSASSSSSFADEGRSEG